MNKLFGKIILSIVLLAFFGCRASYIEVDRIDLNTTKNSIFGMPIVSDIEFVYPCFTDENGVQIDTLEDGILTLIKIDDDILCKYYSNDKLEFSGRLERFPVPLLSYHIIINYETFNDEEIKLYHVNRYIKKGNWIYHEDGKERVQNYKVRISEQNENYFCKKK